VAKRRSRRRAAARPVTRRTFLAVGAAVAGTAMLTGGAAHQGARRLNDVARFPAAMLAELRGGASSHLLERFPALAAHLPWRPLGRHDTPVAALPPVDGAADVRLFIKRDDETSGLYGGNKVRKLEHVLAEAELLQRRTLLTLGGAGTNHGLATALYGRDLGFAVRVALFHQPVTPAVRQNVLGLLHAGAAVHYDAGEFGTLRRVRSLYNEAEAAGDAPYFIMPGGSSRLGCVGFVNAALELGAQVRAGTLPEPDRIFIALGSCGSAAGLVAGLRLAGLRSRVSAVRVTSALVANAVVVRYMANDTLRWLQQAGDGVPAVRAGYGDFDVVTDQFGGGYGHATAAGAAALEWAAPIVAVESTYTAKALAACLEYCRRDARPGETVLYWHTANAAPVRQDGDPALLPEPLRALLG
jgi:D-cysteine desulfhydrase